MVLNLCYTQVRLPDLGICAVGAARTTQISFIPRPVPWATSSHPVLPLHINLRTLPTSGTLPSAYDNVGVTAVRSSHTLPPLGHIAKISYGTPSSHNTPQHMSDQLCVLLCGHSSIHRRWLSTRLFVRQSPSHLLLPSALALFGSHFVSIILLGSSLFFTPICPVGINMSTISALIRLWRTVPVLNIW